jgi:hypothetical protein
MDEDTDEFMDARGLGVKMMMTHEFEDVSIVCILSQMEECLVISLHYQRLGYPPPDKWNGRGSIKDPVSN